MSFTDALNAKPAPQTADAATILELRATCYNALSQYHTTTICNPLRIDLMIPLRDCVVAPHHNMIPRSCFSQTTLRVCFQAASMTRRLTWQIVYPCYTWPTHRWAVLLTLSSTSLTQTTHTTAATSKQYKRTYNPIIIWASPERVTAVVDCSGLDTCLDTCLDPCLEAYTAIAAGNHTP